MRYTLVIELGIRARNSSSEFELGIRARNSSSESDFIIIILLFKIKFYYSLGPVYEFVCVSFSTGNLNCFRVK